MYSLAANTYSRRTLLFLTLKNSNGNLNATAQRSMQQMNPTRTDSQVFFQVFLYVDFETDKKWAGN